MLVMSAIILEAMASYDLCMWHMFYGLSVTHKDINVFDRSLLFKVMSNLKIINL